MSRNSRPPFIPPLKLSVSDAVLRGRHAPSTDDLPDPQAGGEFSGREHTPRDTAAQTEAQEKPKSAVTQQRAAAAEVDQAPTHGEKTGKEATSRTSSRVRDLISKFDRNTGTAGKPSKLPMRNGNTPDTNETAKPGKGRNCDSPRKTTPRDDVSDPSLPDVSGYADDCSIGLLSIEEEANQNSKMHDRWLQQQTEDSKTYVEPRQSSTRRINHRRNSSAGSKPKRTFMENSSKERTLSRAHSSTGSTPLSALFSAPNPVRRVAAAVEIGQASGQSRLSVTRLESRTLKDQTGREATAGSQRASHVVDKSPTNHGPNIRAKWDGSPPNISNSSVGAPGELSLGSSRSIQQRKLIADVANPACDNNATNSCSNQDPTASFVVHDPLMQPPCGATDRPVLEPSEGGATGEGEATGEGGATSEDIHPSDHHLSSNHSTTVKMKQGVAYFLSLLWTIPVKVLLIVVVADWIMRLVRNIPVCRCTRIVRNPFGCPQPPSPRRFLYEQPLDENRRKMMMRGGILLIVLLSCYGFLATDFCAM